MTSLTLSSCQYTLSDFKNKENSGNIPELEALVIEKINKLANRVGAPSYQKTPVFKRYNYNNIPYLIFWNLRKTNNFPTINKTPYSTKLSGNSASLFKFFINTDLESIKKRDV